MTVPQSGWVEPVWLPKMGSSSGTLIGNEDSLSDGVATRVWSMNWPKKTANSLRLRGSWMSVEERKMMLEIWRAESRSAPVGTTEE